MKPVFALLALLSAALALPLSARANLLLNGDFETLVNGTMTGSNHPVAVPDWAVAATVGGANNNSLANLVLGTATGTQASGTTTPTTLPSYQFDGSSTHNQSFDGVSQTVYATQAFTLGAASALSVTAAFGGRDYTSGGTAAGTCRTGRSPGPTPARAAIPPSRSAAPAPRRRLASG